MKVEGKTRTQTNCPRILRCAWAHGGRMERLVRVPYSLYPGYGNTLPLGQPGLSEHKQPDWRHNNGPPAFLARPGLLVPSNASDYCADPYKRAQLKAILSQMNPSLSLRLCKADTKEVGVQVSPRVDKSVQCSLGPRTLHSRSPWGSTGHKAPLSSWGVYSPVMGRRGLVRLQMNGEDEERKALSGPPEASQPPPQLPPPTPRSEEDQQEELRQQEELGEEDASSPRERKSKQAQGDASEPLRKPNFQVYFKQLCCKCQKSFNPYRVEAIQCQTCSKSRCSCLQKKRHIDLRRPHRQELCGRCKDKRFSCGSIYSFKCIM
ncbi:protein ZAR1-like isoform X3 [Physeter macrocephalus]|uniref:Protein ZAR1-like isoform X3 n=1 Tax=Physeter macrocephalus TaxID=9755 RepID=A0A455C9Y1_PHYMC|nr:protein ZAR1-like isoform X3 [Physeter catodon]|eukprot:XP_028353721.1 ZAR1-like protein isoform X3 [Physeter catodon]